MIVFKFKDENSEMAKAAHFQNVYDSLMTMKENQVFLLPSFLDMYIIEEEEGNKMEV